MTNRVSVTLYVSPCGRDSWSGLLPEPAADGSDGPLATPAGALAALRRGRREGPAAGPCSVLLRAGTYHLEEPLAFTAEDSGTAEAPVTFAAFAGERAVLSGGRRITGWQTGEVHGRPCWIADLPEVRAGAWTFTQLFVNGERRWRPRLPKTGTYRFTGVPGTGAAADVTDWERGPTAALYRDGDIQASWKNLDDVKLVVLRLWFEMHHRIRTLDSATRTVQFRGKCFGPLQDEKSEYSRYFADNVFEALTDPGEWYLDRPAGRLYYLPRPGETQAETEVIAPRLAAVVRFAGSEAAPVRHVTLENLVLQHADWDYPADDVGSIQAAYKVPGAVQFDHAEDCALYGCEVAHVAQYGVQTMTGCHHNLIAGCWLHDLGGGGVRIDHEWMRRVNETVPAMIEGRGDRKPMATTVTDCTIHDAGLIHLSAVGLFVGNAGGNRLLHNHIFDVNYTGISCGWTWGYADSATVDNRIEYNHVHHVNWQKILSDNGGIYTLGIHPGGTVKNNHVHHVACFGYGGWGLYPDEGSSEFVIDNNVVHHTEHAGFSTHYGRDNLVRNNIFALAEHAHVHPGKVEAHRTCVLERNLVFWRQGRLGCGTWLPTHFLFRDNLFWNDAGRVAFDDTPLAQWQAGGQLTGT
ncbi:MAG: right-handed parallel beta-helix repeat-containing protein, partial [Lentisphaeria bacterium]